MKKDNLLLKRFKKNWARVAALEDEQLHRMSIKERLYKLASIMAIGAGLGLKIGEDQQKLRVRSRWILLKKGGRR
ncbi:MAG: hypothetical protein KKI13_01850 [Candidatus Omnitrophica bacterium]|nr:hypothetical protein [Candidatus Omnitrophota bacterium]MCG2705567.1 hypothetical protein [Candidatus Omnitrophota bacterium]